MGHRLPLVVVMLTNMRAGVNIVQVSVCTIISNNFSFAIMPGADDWNFPQPEKVLKKESRKSGNDKLKKTKQNKKRFSVSCI